MPYPIWGFKYCALFVIKHLFSICVYIYSRYLKTCQTFVKLLNWFHVLFSEGNDYTQARSSSFFKFFFILFFFSFFSFLFSFFNFFFLFKLGEGRRAARVGAGGWERRVNPYNYSHM